MSAKVPAGVSEAVTEIPGLREAYTRESEAVARIDDIRSRLASAQASIALRVKDREALGARLGRGEAITETHYREASAAMADAEAMAQILADALPEAIQAARRASLAVQQAEYAVSDDFRSPFVIALTHASAVLAAAQASYDRALSESRRLPDDAREELSAVLDAHGRDLEASHRVAEIIRRQDANRQRLVMGLSLISEVA